MKKNEKAIIYGAGAVLLGFGLYRYFQRKKQKAETKPETNKFDPTTFGYPGPNTGPTPYQKKVMDIQSFLGVAVDGIPGPQTNGAWARRAPATFAKYGPIAPANIDFYNALVKGPANLII
jgi:hypothetical protein